MAGVSPRANRDGSITWRVNFRIDGRQAQESFSNEKAAREFGKLVDRVGGAAARAVRLAREEAGVDMPTFGQFADRYLDPASGLLTGISDGTRADYRSILERSLKPTLGEVPVDAITKADIGRWLAWQVEQPSTRYAGRLVSAKTIRNYHGLLSAIFTSAIEEKLRPDNPARGTRLPEGERREPVFLTPTEFDRLHAQIPERHKAFVEFLVVTGCRWGEATALTWGDLNAEADPPTVRVTRAWKKGARSSPVLGTTKSKRGRRTISLWPEVVESLGAPGRPGDLIFPSNNGGHLWHSLFLSRVWRPAVKRADLGKDPNIHDLRHTSASWAIAGGAPLPYIQARLGHEDITTTVNLYGHLMPDAHREMAQVMQQVRSRGSLSSVTREIPA